MKLRLYVLDLYLFLSTSLSISCDDGLMKFDPHPAAPPVPHPATLQSLQAYFDNTWMLTESLFAGLQGEEAFMRRPSHGLRHPLVFYYGHAAALYVNKLRAAGILQVLHKGVVRRCVSRLEFAGERGVFRLACYPC